MTAETGGSAGSVFRSRRSWRPLATGILNFVVAIAFIVLGVLDLAQPPKLASDFELYFRMATYFVMALLLIGSGVFLVQYKVLGRRLAQITALVTLFTFCARYTIVFFNLGGMNLSDPKVAWHWIILGLLLVLAYPAVAAWWLLSPAPEDLDLHA